MKMFDAGKNRMIGLPYDEKSKKNYDDILSRFHTIPACHGQTDRRTELLYQYRAGPIKICSVQKLDIVP